MAHESRLTKVKTSSRAINSNVFNRFRLHPLRKNFKSLAWKFIDRCRYQCTIKIALGWCICDVSRQHPSFASFGFSVKPTETMNVQSIHSVLELFKSSSVPLFKGDPTSFLSLTGPKPALADCVLDEKSEFCKPGNLLSCCARPSIRLDLKLGSMIHHVVGFSDFAKSPCRSNAYEFPIIFAFIVTVACFGSEEFPCGIETKRLHLQKLTPNWASLLYNHMEKEAIGRTGSAKQKEYKRGNKRYKYRNEYKYRAGGGQELLVESRGRTLGCSRDAESRDKRAESDEGLSPTLLCRRLAIVQLAIASEDTVELLICTSEDSDKLRIVLERHYLAWSRRPADDGRFRSPRTRHRHRTNKKTDTISQEDEQADFVVRYRNRGVE
ncbi:uncharacterized protein FOMMEDRAFT_163222 [Fomitiporia mediterranea MF3/22]|uniref:Uncharacterized protein n=1 Tax=Fomitiporia mediterranea (strain MF3/22) TaxID=694068 RepID=R7SGA2_FOMME|nr:uncharacterized protein FOMMEDRAFT_163222 [Fomitiporia mediterranea MF3/22]EJC97465.1 hypothetical protein FOMMEDRAFT_163222 [Fomitiporia mediterranea MF3/22]